MSAQTTVDQISRFEQLLADLKIPSGDLTGVPHQLADAVAQAGFEASPESTPAATTRWSSTTRMVGFSPAGRNGPSNLPRRHCCRNSAQRPKHSKR